VATHILAFEDESQIVFTEGNYSDYESDRRKRLGISADTPHRIQYKKLTRYFNQGDCIWLKKKRLRPLKPQTPSFKRKPASYSIF
jgi:hypothetical protein